MYDCIQEAARVMQDASSKKHVLLMGHPTNAKIGTSAL